MFAGTRDTGCSVTAAVLYGTIWRVWPCLRRAGGGAYLGVEGSWDRPAISAVQVLSSDTGVDAASCATSTESRSPVRSIGHCP